MKPIIYASSLLLLVWSVQITTCLTLGKRCTSEETAYLSAKKPVMRQTQCPDQEKWMNEYVLATANKPITIVSVGCNKAFDIVDSMRTWSGDPFFSVQSLRRTHTTHGLPPQNDGYCHAGAKVDKNTDTLPKRQVQAFCIEPMRTNYDLLKKSFDDLGYDKSIELVYAAASSSTGKAKFPVLKVGRETAGLDRAPPPDASFEEVDIISLDDYFVRQKHNLISGKVIDWLSIDTEGNDARVIIGATELFRTEKIRAFEFEYNRVGHWQNASLEDVIDQLDHFDFDCYWEFNNGDVTRLTGCWDNSFYVRSHSNVVCAHRKSVLAPILSKLHHTLHPSLSV